MKQQIIAMGGGFSIEESPAMDGYVLAQARVKNPKICFLPTASGDADSYSLRFMKAFAKLDCTPEVLSLFKPHVADIEQYLMRADIIYVGGGNTKSMLAVWREWKLDSILKAALSEGTVLAGISAGAICWFESGLTDSVFGSLQPLKCLGYLKGSACPHYGNEINRVESFKNAIKQNELPGGYGVADGTALHFINGELRHHICIEGKARSVAIVLTADGVSEQTIDTYLDIKIND